MRLATLGYVVTALVLSFTAEAVAQGTGYWHTSGNQILDSSNRLVRIAGINWYGFETTDQVAHGLWAQDYHTILKAIKDNGYNAIRLPFSNQMVENPVFPSSIAFANGSGSINADLKGLSSLQVMDKIIAAAGSLGLRVILDNHRSEAGNSAEANGLWYTSSYPESAWLNDWTKLIRRYASFTDGSGKPIVIAADLRNEPHLLVYGAKTGACWTGDAGANSCPTTNTAQNWPGAAERAGNAILAANPNLLIIVEGAECYNGDCDWWGGNLEGVATHPVVLNVSNRLVYSPHDYGPNLFQQSWFNSSTDYASLAGVWNRFWGYISVNNIAPVMVGEFGTDNNSSDIQSSVPGSQGHWFQALVNFFQNNPGLSWTYWAFNGEDSYGLLDSHYDSTPASSLKQSMLASIQSPLSGGGSGGTSGGSECTVIPSAPSNLRAAVVSSTQVNLSWNAVSPPSSNCAISYSIYQSTVAGFTPSFSNQIAGGLSVASYANIELLPSVTYYYKVVAVDHAGSSRPSTQASASTPPSGSSGFTCHVAYTIVNQWNTGFQAAITIVNTGTAAITSWTLQWRFPGNQQITGLWNGTYTQAGAAVTVNSMSYNSVIPAGGSYAGVGFTANFTGINVPPANFLVNGTACH